MILIDFVFWSMVGGLGWSSIPGNPAMKVMEVLGNAPFSEKYTPQKPQNFNHQSCNKERQGWTLLSSQECVWDLRITRISQKLTYKRCIVLIQTLSGRDDKFLLLWMCEIPVWSRSLAKGIRTIFFLGHYGSISPKSRISISRDSQPEASAEPWSFPETRWGIFGLAKTWSAWEGSGHWILNDDAWQWNPNTSCMHILWSSCLCTIALKESI